LNLLYLIHSQLGTTGNYSVIVDLHTLPFTVTHALQFSMFTSRILATDFITVSLSHQITHGVLFSQPNYFLAIILQMPTQFNSKHTSWQAGVSNTTLFSTRFASSVSFYNSSARTTQKTQPLLLTRRVYWSGP
jgi:hypothetical protein